jgi:hypothetical protein
MALQVIHLKLCLIARKFTVAQKYLNPVVVLAGPGLEDDTYSKPLDIGFAFCFLGVQYTQCYIGSNGWLSFGGPGALATTFTSEAIPSTDPDVPKNCIMGPWQDWYPTIVYTGWFLYYVPNNWYCTQQKICSKF